MESKYMDMFRRILPMLWQIVEKNKNCTVNITTFEDKLTVRILRGRRAKSFSHSDENILISELQAYLIA
jgi:hypothetical protein